MNLSLTQLIIGIVLLAWGIWIVTLFCRHHEPMPPEWRQDWDETKRDEP